MVPFDDPGAAIRPQNLLPMNWLSVLSIGARVAGFGSKLAGLSIVNPWVIIAAGIALAGAGAGGLKLGYSFSQALCKSAEADRRALADEIRSANIDLANNISERTERAIGKIRVNHRTVIQPEIRHEREIHKVLQDPACALPPSTVRVLNTARGYIDRGPTPSEPDSAVRAPEPAPDSEAAPPR